MARRILGAPLTFNGCTGFVHDGGGTTGILMLPAWGFEEFTIRRGWAGFADLLADAGYRCLRFDWPGAGDSLGDTGSTVALADWRGAVIGAAELLKRRYDLDKVILIGHGVGGLLAPHFAAELSPSAMVLMAPQNEGRAGFRELDLASKLIGSILKLPEDATAANITVAGHSMTKSLADEIAALRLDQSGAQPALPVLTMLRAGTKAATEWPKRLRAAGFDVSEADYSAYDGFLAYDKASVAPVADFEHIRDWLVEVVPPGPKSARHEPAIAVEPLKSEWFTETPMRFGEGGRLFGVLCQPAAGPHRAAIILINSGDTYHIGWARSHVALARSLAQQGIASFRIDTSGIGDSASKERPIFYDDAQIQDVLEAVATVETLSPGPILVSGLCSGGYASLQAAVRDPRIKGMVAINPVRLAIAPDETVEQVLSGGTTSLAGYRRRAFSLQIWKDVLTGHMTLGSITSKGMRILKARLTGYRRGVRLTRTAREQAETLRSRGVASVLIYAENDAGLDELARYFGRRPAASYDNAIVRVVSDTEHNMTARHAREAVLQGIIDAAQASISSHAA